MMKNALLLIALIFCYNAVTQGTEDKKQVITIDNEQVITIDNEPANKQLKPEPLLLDHRTMSAETDAQRKQLPTDMQQTLLNIEKNEIDRRVEYLQHEQNKFLTVMGIVLAVSGLVVTLLLFVAGYFMSKSLGEKFDTKEREMENRMQLLEKDTALRLEKLNMEVDYSEKSLEIIQLKIDEAVRRAMEKMEDKSENETQKFEQQLRQIIADNNKNWKEDK